MAVAGIARLGLARGIGVEGREDDRRRERIADAPDGQIRRLRRNRARQDPPRRLGVAPSRRPFRRRRLGEHEPGVAREELDETLPDRARRSQDRHRNLFRHRIRLLPEKRPQRKSPPSRRASFGSLRALLLGRLERNPAALRLALELLLRLSNRNRGAGFHRRISVPAKVLPVNRFRSGRALRSRRGGAHEISIDPVRRHRRRGSRRRHPRRARRGARVYRPNDRPPGRPRTDRHGLHRVRSLDEVRVDPGGKHRQRRRRRRRLRERTVDRRVCDRRNGNRRAQAPRRTELGHDRRRKRSTSATAATRASAPSIRGRSRRGSADRLDSMPDGLAYVAATKEVWVTTRGTSRSASLDAATLEEKAKLTFDGNRRGPRSTANAAVSTRTSRTGTARSRSTSCRARPSRPGTVVRRRGPSRSARRSGGGTSLRRLQRPRRGHERRTRWQGALFDRHGRRGGRHRLRAGDASPLRGSRPSRTDDDREVRPEGKLSVVATVKTPVGARNPAATDAGSVYLAHPAFGGLSGIIVVEPAK